MKKKYLKHMASLELKLNEVIEKITQVERIAFDEASFKFKSSITYKVFTNPELDFESIFSQDIFNSYNEEMAFRKELNPILVSDMARKDIIKEVVAKIVVFNNLAIREAYESFVVSKTFASLSENNTDEASVIYEKYCLETKAKKRVKIK